MSGFKFEKNLSHQIGAVNSVLGVFAKATSQPIDNKILACESNPLIKISHKDYADSILYTQQHYQVKGSHRNVLKNILDISMETGTGKTYTYTKMMLEMYQTLGIQKFIVIVPTLSIKAGTVNFLTSKATKDHFRPDYKCEIKTYVVESQKANKNKKSHFPSAIFQFLGARTQGNDNLHVLIINSGMINSPTMEKSFDVGYQEKYFTPFDALAAINPVTIIDEPHKFPTSSSKKTWKKIQNFKSQYLIRYGATFNDNYYNLIYNLSAVDAFNDNLVKGVIAYVEEFSDGGNVALTLKNCNTNEASFELNVEGKKSTHKLIKGASLSKIHEAMHDLTITAMNMSKVVLSNGLELTKTSRINPFSYAQSLQDKMIEKALKKHFELEREFLTREVKIKPLTLFFIDDIAGYRDGNKLAGSLKVKFEELAGSLIKNLLKTETNSFYRKYLEKSLSDLSLIHGGYFSKDNSEKDEKIEKEINEILHDKESLLNLENPRRFIFSKWTLREGWDNPNVFQICKLRSSGSMTSKLQEVGRGLRLPVNEFKSRVKDELFDLHYYVDFTEKDFVDKLVDEINSKSGVLDANIIPTKLTQEIIDKIIQEYRYTEDEILEALDTIGAIKRNNDFKENGFEKTKTLYPNVFEKSLNANKVRKADKKQSKVTFRAGKYSELKELWEKINQKVVLEYKIKNEIDFQQLLKSYFLSDLNRFKQQGINTTTSQLIIEDSIAAYKSELSIEDEIMPIVTMTYKSFILELAQKLCVNMTTLHQVFIELKGKLNINDYLNIQTIRIIRDEFNHYLLKNAIDKFSIGYKKVSNSIHPTKFTNAKGILKSSINSSDVGVQLSAKLVADNYLLNELYYDSDLEEENISTNIKEVIVFTKIPKNSIRIPVAGGATYSPDFAYVVKNTNNEKILNLIVETKDHKSKTSLREDETHKIRHAEKLFSSNDFKVEFKTQLKNNNMVNIIKEILKVN